MGLRARHERHGDAVFHHTAAAQVRPFAGDVGSRQNGAVFHVHREKAVATRAPSGTRPALCFSGVECYEACWLASVQGQAT